MIRHIHVHLEHAGLHSILREMKINFISLIINPHSEECCIVCRCLNTRPIKLNQSYYKDFRENPNLMPSPT